ncbi:MAG TPA: glycosyltransferase family 39 protein [Thermoanaerobaculia bacterium]|nr:glycosyltransferase family 39 protein [Thermoanaerobaculia bacterium]
MGNQLAAHPVLVAAPFLRLGDLLGFHGPRALTWFAALPTALFSTAAIGLLWRLSRELGWSDAAARAAAFLLATQWLAIGFASMPFPRPISTALLLAGFVLVARPDAGRLAAFGAGAAAAAAMAVRWSEGVAVVPLAAFALWRTRRPARTLAVLAGFAVGLALFVGLFDAATAGSPFATLRAFVEFSRASPSWSGDRGVRPWYWYATNVLGWAGPALVLIAAFGARDRRAWTPLLVALAAVVLLSFSPVKRPRYLQAAVPFLAMAAGLGWERLRRRRGWLATAALVAAAALGLERTLHMLRHKSMAAAAAAAALSAMTDPPRVVVLEQSWAYGGALAFPPGTEIRDITPRRALRADALRSVARGADVVALYAEDLAEPADRLLGEAFRPCATLRVPDSPDVVVFLPSSRACSALVLAPGVSGSGPGS